MTQGVAGSFLGLFAYALFVLTAVHDPAQTGPGFIPTISITVAIGFSLLGLVLLLLFFHHTAEIYSGLQYHCETGKGNASRH